METRKPDTDFDLIGTVHEIATLVRRLAWRAGAGPCRVRPVLTYECAEARDFAALRYAIMTNPETAQFMQLNGAREKVENHIATYELPGLTVQLINRTALASKLGPRTIPEAVVFGDLPYDSRS